MTRLEPEARVTIETLVSRGTSNAAVARLLGVSEGAVRYHVARMAAGAADGRSAKQLKATMVAGAIEHWREMRGEDPINLAAPAPGSASTRTAAPTASCRRSRAPPPANRAALRARRRVETPAGAQAQADWAHFQGVIIGGEVKNLIAFKMVLSHSRKDAIVWSESKDMLAWLGGVPATVASTMRRRRSAKVPAPGA